MRNTSNQYTYSLYKRRNKQKKYAVKAYFNGNYDDDETYYTDDWDQAVRKINKLAKEKNLTLRSKKNMFIADSLNKDLHIRAMLPYTRNENNMYIIYIDFFNFNNHIGDDYDVESEILEYMSADEAYDDFLYIIDKYNLQYVCCENDAYIARNYIYEI